MSASHLFTLSHPATGRGCRPVTPLNIVKLIYEDEMRNRSLRLTRYCASLMLPIAITISGLSGAYAQTDSFTQADRDLLTRQQLRLNGYDEAIKSIQGMVEVEFREINTQLEKLSASVVANSSGSSADVQSLQAKLSEISDTLTIMNQRISRTFEMSSDIEFRVLRLEKRVNTLLSLSDSSLSEAIIQDDVTAAGVPADVSLSRDEQTSQTVWSIDSGDLQQALDEQNSLSTDDNVSSGPADNSSSDAAVENAGTADNQTSLTQLADAETPSEASQEAQPVKQPSILPDASPEEQYRFALGRALQNDLAVAADAFAEFRDLNPEDERSADALFWLGRVQYMQGEFEDSAMTFSEFNTTYQDDPRLVDTTLWIAESVAQFAKPEQACEVYATLIQLLDQPPENFVKRLKELSERAACETS